MVKGGIGHGTNCFAILLWVVRLQTAAGLPQTVTLVPSNLVKVEPP